MGVDDSAWREDPTYGTIDLFRERAAGMQPNLPQMSGSLVTIKQTPSHSSVYTGCRMANGAEVMSVQHIMVATDGSTGADRAVKAAAEFTMAFGAELSIVTFAGSFSAEEVGKLARVEGGVGEAIELVSNIILRDAKERATGVAASNIRTSIGWGDAAQGIVDAARREKADIVVVGRRGRGQLAGLLLGSVSQKVASLAPCIVVVVP
ncbi:MAG: universal stress protein [Methylocystis silviterrae]